MINRNQGQAYCLSGSTVTSQSWHATRVATGPDESDESQNGVDR